MVDYNDGKWHSYTGEHLPVGVHPESRVNTYFIHCGRSPKSQTSGRTDNAGDQFWNNVIAFRVVKEYVDEEPLTSTIATVSQNVKDAVIVLNDAMKKAQKEGVVTHLKVNGLPDIECGVTPVVVVGTSLRL